MIRFMRENASSWVIKILLFIVVIVFVFLGINPGNKKIHDSAAVVNKQAISFQEFDTAYKNVLERYSRQLGDNLSDDVIKMLRIKENTLENLINRAVILQEARKRGIDVNDKELQNLISSVPYFQKGGQFNLGLYNNYFSVTHQNPEVFEDQLRNDFLFKKIKGFVDDTSMVTDDEIREWYAWEKTESSIAYVAFSPDSVKDVTPSKDELTAYYEKHVDSYKSDATAVVKLIQFAPEEFKSKVSVTEKDIENDYNANQSKYELPKTVQARHILIKVAEDADDAAVEKAKARAQDVYRMATVEKKDFAGLAKTYSEDASKDKGGELGTFERKDMVKPFADKAFSMKAGEISEPVKTQFGWHVIKVDKVNEPRQKSLAEVKPEIEKRLMDKKMATMAYEASENAGKMFVDTNGDLSKAAESVGLPVIETKPFTLEIGPSEVRPEARADFAKAVFDMAVKQTSDVLEFKGNYYIAQMVEKKKSEIQPLDAVKARVEADLSRELKDSGAKKEAANLIADIKAGKTTLEGQAGVKKTGFFTRDNPGTDPGLDKGVVKEAFARSTEKPLSDTPVKGKLGYYVIKLIEKKRPEMNGVIQDADKSRIRRELLERKQAQAFDKWLSELKAKSKIERNESVLN